MSGTFRVVSWIIRLAVALILLQTLFFKFTGAAESKYIFSTLRGAEYEAFGRIGSGIMELVASILILIPKTAAYGALLTLGVISGAIFSHLTLLGIEVENDGGTLFGLAIAVFTLSMIVLIMHRRQLPFIGGAS